MKQSTDKTALIRGIKHKLSDEEEYILYAGRWYEVQFDQDGDYYFMLNDKAIYFTIHYKERV